MSDRLDLADRLEERANRIDDKLISRVIPLHQAHLAERNSVDLRAAARELRSKDAALAELARLRDGISRHRQQVGHLGSDANPALWALIEDDCATVLFNEETT